MPCSSRVLDLSKLVVWISPNCFWFRQPLMLELILLLFKEAHFYQNMYLFIWVYPVTYLFHKIHYFLYLKCICIIDFFSLFSQFWWPTKTSDLPKSFTQKETLIMLISTEVLHLILQTQLKKETCKSILKSNLNTNLSTTVAYLQLLSSMLQV